MTTDLYRRKNLWEMRYHETIVFSYNEKTGGVTLDTGGWWTSTTKRRMNTAFEFVHLPFKVYQKRGFWYVAGEGGIQVAQFEGHTLSFQVTTPHPLAPDTPAPPVSTAL